MNRALSFAFGIICFIGLIFLPVQTYLRTANAGEGSLVQALPFVDSSISIQGAFTSSVDWGDFDHDGDQDIILAGCTTTGCGSRATIVYRNIGNGSFAVVNTSNIPAMDNASVAWGDYDNDLYLDILLTGRTSSGTRLSKVFHNNGNATFTDLNLILENVDNANGCCAATWGDYNNDGRLDFLYSGWYGSKAVTKIYRNNGGGNFTSVAANLTGFARSSLDWGDFDKDGDLDIVICGSLDLTSNRASKVYRNNGNDNFEEIPAGLIGVWEGSVAWGDYDLDNDLDILLTGASLSSGNVAKLYRNNGNGSFEAISTNFLGVTNSSVAWADYDADGYPDILLTGYSGSAYIAKIYHNNGDGTFADLGSGLEGIRLGSVAWGDYDQDGDLDILATGYSASGPMGKIYRNTLTIGPRINAAPTSIPADGTSTTLVGLSNAPAGHKVRLLSSRGPLDIFGSATGMVTPTGQYMTTLRSTSIGSSVITAQDLTSGQTFATSTTIAFTPISGGTLPPDQSGPIVITDVEGDCGQIDCPTEGFFMLGLQGLQLPLSINIDWKSNPAGVVDLTINGQNITLPATGGNVRYKLDINKYLLESDNLLRIVARNGNQKSKPYDLHLFGYRLPQWIMNGVNQLPIIGNQALMLEISFPGQPLGDENPIDWGFPGSLNQFQWQTNLVLTLPTRGGAFEIEINRERDHAATGRKPKAFLKLLGHEADIHYSGSLSGILSNSRPYIIVQELEINASLASSYTKQIGIVEALNLLIPFGPEAYIYLKTCIPCRPLTSWLNDRANLYFKITSELSGDFKLGFQPTLHLVAVELGVDFPIEIGAQVNLWAVEGKIYGGLGGKGTFGYATDNLNIVSLQAYGFGGYKFRFLFTSIHDDGEWKLVEYPSGSGQMRLIFVPSSEAKTWEFIPHNTSANYAVFSDQRDHRQAFRQLVPSQSGSNLLENSTYTSILVSNVYTYTEPSLAVNPTNNHALLLWVHDVISKPVGQSHEINFSQWDGSTWSMQTQITDDQLLDGAPQVAWTGAGDAIAVWHRLNDTLPITATWDITTAQKIEIATAVFNPGTGLWSATTLLTNNAALDMQPYLARNTTGELLLVWRQNPAGLVYGDKDNPDRILAAFHNGSWGSAAAVVENIPGLVDLAVGYGNNVALVAYTRYLTSTGSLTPTLQLFTSAWDGVAWSAPIQQTNDSLDHKDVQVVYNNTNQPLLIWLAGSELHIKNLISGASSSLTLPAGIGSVDEFRLTQDASGNLAAVFTTSTSQRDLYLSFYSLVNNSWGLPRRLTNNLASERYPTPAIDSTGRLLMGYASTVIAYIEHTTIVSGTLVTYTLPSEGQTDLITLSHIFESNLTLATNALAVSDDHPAPGSTVMLNATVQNTGDFALANVIVKFYDGDPSAGGILINSASIPTPLAAGFTAVITTTYTVPTSGGAHRLYVVADPDHTISEVNEGDNIASLDAFGPDLTITSAFAEAWGGSDVGLHVVVNNPGNVASPNTSLKFFVGSSSASPSVTTTISSIQAGHALTITTPWNYSSLASGTYTITVVVNQGDFTETFTANNDFIFNLDVLPDMMVSPYYLWTTPLSNTTVVITTTLFNLGSQPADNIEIKFYTGEILDPANIIYSTTVAHLSPASSVVITHSFNGPLCSGINIWVDPEFTISETTRVNNMASVLPCNYQPYKIYIPLISRSPSSSLAFTQNIEIAFPNNFWRLLIGLFTSLQVTAMLTQRHNV